MPPSWTPFGKEFPCKWIFHSFNVQLWPSKTRSQSSRGENGSSVKGTTITPQEYAKAIRNTFLKEMDLGMVINPTDKMQAAKLCRFQPDDLCFGSMANVNKLDKIRAISDGSKGGANVKQEVHPRPPAGCVRFKAVEEQRRAAVSVVQTRLPSPGPSKV